MFLSSIFFLELQMAKFTYRLGLCQHSKRVKTVGPAKQIHLPEITSRLGTKKSSHIMASATKSHKTQKPKKANQRPGIVAFSYLQTEM